jgi:Flp pilus assembly pilin Flp
VSDMKRSRTGLPIFLPLAIFLFDVLATVVVFSYGAHSASISRNYGLILLPGSLFLSGGPAVAFNVGLAGMIEWLSRRMLADGRITMFTSVLNLWSNEDGQDIAEYAVMLAVILVIVVGTIRLIGSNTNNVFSSVASSVR